MGVHKTTRKPYTDQEFPDEWPYTKLNSPWSIDRSIGPLDQNLFQQFLKVFTFESKLEIKKS
ncbi:hypothetical protein GCM10022258_27220 [Aquimarina gracilis]